MMFRSCYSLKLCIITPRKKSRYFILTMAFSGYNLLIFKDID
jgi:hypothetical protein